jgi:DNA-binding HxlR family transcriptional regulator
VPKGYGQYCPLAKASELVAERWTPLVLRELLFGGHTFNTIMSGVPLMSRSLLSKRLRELERAGLVERRAVGPKRSPEYHLTQAGAELGPVLIHLAEWGMRWARFELRPEDLDPRPLLWDIHRHINVDRLPPHRVVVNFVFTDVPRAQLRRTWLVLEGEEVDVCYTDPGYPVDLLVTTPVRTLVAVWLGDVKFAEALRTNEIQVDGKRELARAFPGWLALSPVAGAQFREPAVV